MSASATTVQEDFVPLCVDLDGTLIKTDLLWESLMRLLKRNPAYLFLLPFWWLRGRACLKRQIATRATEFDAITLPYSKPLLEFLRAEQKRGRPIILATASDRELAMRVAEHLGLFNEVLGSDGQTNLRGQQKLQALSQRFGAGGFDYAGNSSVDLKVWKQARQAIVVNASDNLVLRVRKVAAVNHTFNPPKARVRALVQALRLHQWVKNLIIFVPLFTAHQLAETPRLFHALWAFAAFCLCASSVYVLNDLLDLDADRHHPTKKLRPFASGDLPLPVGLVLATSLLVASVGIAAALSWNFLGVLAFYVLLTTSYSWRLKQIALLDVFVLAALYTIRLIAGHEAADVKYSSWLLMFSMFIFLSLALVKRFVELAALRQQNQSVSKGRGYFADDVELVAMLGSISGYLSVLVLALYVNSEQVVKLYAHPTRLLLVCPLFLYWISRVWMIAHRGQMHDDPIVFALKDRVSYVIGALTLVVLWLATGR